MIVMKFGGTSVQDAKAIDRAAQIVQGRLADRPVVVVSAMAKVTDSLLAMGKAAGSGATCPRRPSGLLVSGGHRTSRSRGYCGNVQTWLAVL